MFQNTSAPQSGIEEYQEYQGSKSIKELDIKEVNTKRAEFRASDITSSSGKSPDNGILNTEQRETVGPINEKISAITKALAEISNGITSIEEDIGKEAVESISDIQDKIYEQRETAKPGLVVASPDTNYKRDKGGNHRMFLTYNCDNNKIRFFKDDNAFIVIKNDAVKNIGGFYKFCSEIEEECEKK